MNRIKDFFYDKNDIIVAVAILIAAAVVIYIRVDKIMAYPETLLNSTTQQEQEQASQEMASEASDEEATGDAKPIQIANDPIPATVAKQLETAGIISSAADFEAALKKYKVADRIQPGSYQIPTGMTNEQVIQVITGETI
ncbi:MAG: endolytic transglycosylase MltG [Firmicutes bacterium]|nr:endolytic transglycosylase MltG [Bacillota bacterium]